MIDIIFQQAPFDDKNDIKSYKSMETLVMTIIDFIENHYVSLWILTLLGFIRFAEAFTKK